MAGSLSRLHRHTNSFLHAFHAEGRGDRPTPPSPSLRIHSSLQKNCPCKIPFAGSSSPRLLSLRLSSSLISSKENPPLRFSSLVTDPNMNVGVGCSSNGQTRRPMSFKRRAISEENAADEAVAENSDFLPPGWPTVAVVLFGLGFLIGPPLDGIHSRVGLQVYDNGAINVFGLQTNIWVPPLLGVFYSLAGLLSLVFDRKLSRNRNIPTANLTKVAASLVSLAVLLELSAELYHANVPANIEGYTLFFCAQLNWILLDNTWWGFALAFLIGVTCPLAEIPIVKAFGLWHYPQANVSLFGEGFVTWVICCYFFYTPFISNLARWLVKYPKELEEPKQ